jgi:hypothetical protein
MAGVKTSRGGASKAPVFAPTLCAECGLQLLNLKDAKRVLRISYEPKAKRLQWLCGGHIK